MLRELQIKNVALIESVRLSLEDGFTCLTGETGAGKSILLDAVGLLLGSRASVDLVRTGEDKAVVEGMFEFASGVPDSLVTALQEQGIDVEEGQLVIAREVTRTGKTTARVCGRIVTAQFLREIAGFLVHQHGQHDSTALLRKEEHIVALDSFGGAAIDTCKREYIESYARMRELSRTLADAEKSDMVRAQRLDMLSFQVQEIEAARIKVGEEEKLRALRGRLRYAERLRSAVDDVYESLYEPTMAKQSGILSEVQRLLTVVNHALTYDENLQSLREYLETAKVNLEEAVDSARRYRDDIEFEPDKLQRLEDRLAHLERLFRKYGETSEEVLAYGHRAKTERETLMHHDEMMEALRAQLATAEEDVMKRALGLRDARTRAADAFTRLLSETLESLQMQGVRLSIAMTPIVPGANGADDVEILFSANRGEAVKPLAKIASGGELSRVMLAMVQVLTGKHPVPTLIFDEIDTGISGRAAQAVAERIANISAHHQVLCVTHMPQMASMAKEHLLLEKRTIGDRTVTEVRRLSPAERIDEVSRMISGQHVTSTTRKQAQEMLARSTG